MGNDWIEDTISRDKESDPFLPAKKQEAREAKKKKGVRARLNHVNRTSNIRRADLRNGTDSDV